MKWVSENRTLAVTIIVMMAVLGLALSQKPQNSVESNKDSFKDSYATINSASKMRRGDENAKVQFIQYSDFLCPSCSYVSTKIMPTIDKEYIAAGKVQFEFRPMAFIADGSVQAGMGAFCAIDQDKFWTYHDAIYEYVYNKVYNESKNPKSDLILNADIVKTIASGSGVDQEKFDSCLDSGEHLSDINKSTKQANNDGVNGTPYLLIDGQVLNSAPNLQTVEAMIKAAL